ncbi:MAG: cysteine hydrolase [Firmicutes bacterium]|nr:cysteine hydrolase [Bacillota bacterium]
MKLIVIDMQKGILSEGLYDLKGVLENVAKVIDAARNSGTEVIYVKHDDGPGSGFTFGDEDYEIADEIAPANGEKVFVKTIPSSFSNKEFAAYLEGTKDDALMIVGLQTDFCIDSTVKSAAERGYRVIVPKGTNSTFDNPYMTGEKTCGYFFCEVWPDLFAECVSLEEAMELIRK